MLSVLDKAYIGQQSTTSFQELCATSTLMASLSWHFWAAQAQCFEQRYLPSVHARNHRHDNKHAALDACLTQTFLFTTTGAHKRPEKWKQAQELTQVLMKPA